MPGFTTDRVLPGRLFISGDLVAQRIGALNKQAAGENTQNKKKLTIGNLPLKYSTKRHITTKDIQCTANRQIYPTNT